MNELNLKKMTPGQKDSRDSFIYNFIYFKKIK